MHVDEIARELIKAIEKRLARDEASNVREFAGFPLSHGPLREPIKYVPFWSDLVEWGAEQLNLL